jgi:hypothetical protein
MSAALVFERRLTAILRASDPARALAAAANDRTLPAALRRAFGAADPDGVCLAALLVIRLRFERLLRGSRAAAAWFEADPTGFTAGFRRYHTAVAPTAFFPGEEASLFDGWAGKQRRAFTPLARRSA